MEPASSECDCESGLSVASFVNHRGEAMRQEQHRRSKSVGRRTRGLGEVRMLRSRSTDQVSTGDERSSEGGPVPISLRRSGAPGANLLQYNGELFVPVRAVGGGGFVDKHAPPHPGVAIGRESPAASNLPDYMFYTLRNQPSAREANRDSPPARASSRASEATSVLGSCPSCAQLRAKVSRLEREKDVMRSENRSLLQQLKASKRGLKALEKGSVSELEEAVFKENEALQKEVAELRGMVEKAPTGQEGHCGSIADLKDLLHSYLKEEKVEMDARLVASRQTIAETQEALLEERRQRREAVSDTERQLVEENAAMRSRSLGLQHEVRLALERKEELQTELQTARGELRELQAALGKATGVLPDMSSDESELLLSAWCDIPEEVKECMDSPASLQAALREEDGCESKEEMIQCLWYRHKVAAKALHLLQGRLEALGITSEDQLGELATVERRMQEKEQQLATLQSHVKAIAAGQDEFATQNSGKMADLVTERNELLGKLDDLLAQNRLLDMQRQHAEKANQEGLELLLQRLGENFEGAELRDAMERAQAENALLKIGRGDVGPDAQVAAIHDVLQLTDPQELRTRCVQLANERDAFLQQLRAEQERNSDSQRLAHAQHLQLELQQTVEDRRQLREQVAHFTAQLAEALSKHQEQMTERDRELTVLRLKLQESLQERDEIKVEWEKERRNANDLKVTYHKEIKNQSQQARKEVEQEVVELRRRLDEATKELRILQLHRSGPDAHNLARGIAERCDSVLEALERQTKSQTVPESLTSARHMLQDLKDSLQDGPEAEEELLIAPKRAQGQFASRQAIESTVEMEAAARGTDQASAELLKKLNDSSAFGCMDPEEVRNAVLRLGERFEAERAALKRRAESAGAEAEAAGSRARAAQEAGRTLERQLRAAQEEAEALRGLREENRRAQAELQRRGANEKAITSLRNRVEQLKRDRTMLRAQAGQRYSGSEELRRKLDKAKEARDHLAIDLKAAHGERDRLRASLATQQELASKLEQQVSILKEEMQHYHRGMKEKNAENFELQDSLMAKEQENAALRQDTSQLRERLTVESEQRQRIGEAKSLLEAQIKDLKTQLLDVGESGTMGDVAQKIQELKERVTELRESLRTKDHSSHDLEAQLTMYQHRLDDLDTEMTQERSLLLVAQSRCVALEDENEWLRTQNEALQRRTTAPKQDDSRSRGEMINELILRSQTKAQALLATNPNLARSFNFSNGMLSPTSDVTDHFGLGISRSMDLEP